MAGQDDFFEELRREYLTEAPARLAELRKDLAATRAGESGAAASLRTRLHRLAGSGGSYGFPAISQTSRAAEKWLTANPAPTRDALETLEASIGLITKAFDQASLELGLPMAPPQRTSFGWQAIAVGYAGGPLDRIESTLAAAQYAVQRQPPGGDPAGIPVSERPDVAVLDGALDRDELEDVVERWARPAPSRPGTVVLVADSPGVDPLAFPFAHLDLIVSPGRVEPDLLRFVQSLGRSKTSPRTVLVVAADETTVGTVGAALEASGIRIVSAGSGAELRSVFQSAAPDLVVVSWVLPDTAGPAVVRWVRQTPANRLIPIVLLAPELSETDRITAERAGVDLILTRGVSRSELAATLAARIERGRLARSLAHRDDLTGLLGQTAMLEVLEHAVAQARRSGEPLAYLALDLDHFRRVNEQHGQAAGDLVLIHLARLVSGTVRAGDFVARTGGEEIGILVRRCSLENAAKLGETLRASLSREPVAAGLDPIPIRVSVGVAAFPDHGTSASELVRAADRAVAQAKAAGRDRVVVA